MADIVDRVQQVSHLIAEISVASGHQTEGLTQINESVRSLDDATQQNAALVEQSAAAAESLDVQARRLVEAVAAFRLSVSQADESSEDAVLAA